MAKGRQLKASAAAGAGGPASAPAAYDYLPPHNARPGPSSYSPNAHNNKPLPKVTYRKPPPSSSSSSSASAPFSKHLPPPDPSPSRPRPPRPDSALSTSTAYSARAAVVHTASRAVPVKKGKVYSVKRSSNRDSGLSSRDSLASLTDDGGASEYDPDEQAREMPMRRALPAKLDIAKASRVNHQDSMASPQPTLNYPSPTEGAGRPTKSNSTLSINVAAMSSSSSSQSNAARRRSKGVKQPPMPQRSDAEPSGVVGAQWASLASEPDSFDADGNLDKLAAWSSSTDLHASARKMKWKEAVEMAQARQPNGISHAHTPSEPRGTAYLLNSLLSSHASIEMASSFTQPAFASVEEYELAKRELRRLQDRLADKKSRLRTLKRIRGAVGKLAKASTPAGPSRSASINGLQTPLGAHADLPASASDVSVTSIANSSGRPRRPTLAGQQHSRNLSNITSFSTTTESQGLGASHEAAVEQVDRMVEEVLGLQEKIEGLKTRLREHVARVLLERCEALEADKGLPREHGREGDEASDKDPSASSAELEEARQQHQIAQNALAQSQAALRESQQAHDQTRETLQQAQRSLAESERNLTASKKATTDLQARVGERERADRASSSRLAKLEAELASEQGRTQQLSTSLASMRSDHDALRTKHDTVNRELESMRAAQGDHSSQAASALARYEELELAVSAERKIMAERDALFHAFEARLERAEGTLRDQDRRCAALLGKAEGREELDDFLAKIRGGGAKAKEKTAGQDIDQLLSSLGQHVEDLADEMARRRRGDDSFSYNGDGSRNDDFSRADELEDQLEQSRNEATRLRAQVEDGRLQIEALNSSLNRPDSTSRVVSARLSSKPAHWRSPSTASSSAAAAHQVQELQDRVSTMARENEELRERLASRSAGSDSSLVKVGGSDDGRGDFDASLPLVTSLEKLLPDGLSAGMDLSAFLAALNSVPPSVSAESSVLLTRLRTVINLARTSTERALARNTDTPSSDAPTSTALSRSSTVASAQTKAGLRSTGLKPIQISKSGFLPYRSIGDGLPGTAPPTPAKDNSSSGDTANTPKSAGSLMPPRGLVPRRSFSAMDASTSPNSASSPLPSPSYPRTAGPEVAGGGSTTFLTSPSEASSTAQLMSRLRNLESQLHTLKSGKRAAVERCEALEAKLVDMEAELEEGRKREVRWLEGMNDASANAAGKGLGGGNGPPSTAAAVSTPTKAGQGQAQGQDQLSVSRPGDSPTRSPSPRLFNIALPVLTGWGGSGAPS